MSAGVQLIAAERRRQIEQEGWSAEHDARHACRELAKAAACYVRHYADHAYGFIGSPTSWPWGADWWKPAAAGDPIRDLVKAGALIAAELDRVLLAEQGPAYEFGAMSSVYTLRAKSELVAHAVMLLFMETSAPIVIYKPERKVLGFALLQDPEARLAEHFGCDFGEFVRAHDVEIQAASRTVREGTLG